MGHLIKFNVVSFWISILVYLRQILVFALLQYILDISSCGFFRYFGLSR